MAEKDLDPENIRISKEKDFKITFTVDSETGGCSWEIKNLPGSELGHGCAPINKDIEDEMGAHPITRINTSEFEVKKETETSEKKTTFAGRPQVVGFESLPAPSEKEEKKKIKGSVRKRLEEGQ